MASRTINAGYYLGIRRQAWVVSAIALGLVSFNGCIGITKPVKGSTLPAGPVVAEVGFRSQVCGNSFHASLDGNDVTQQFNPQPPANTLPQATFTNLSAGSHTLNVSAQTLQYWILFPYCDAGSDSVTFSIQGSPLGFSPAGPVTIDAGATSSVQVTTTPAASNQVAITLAANPADVTLPGSTTIAAGQTSSPPLTVTGQIGGSAAITASATGFPSGTLTVNVKPVITSVTPTSGIRGTPVTINGKGFAAGSTVTFGSQGASSTFVSQSQMKSKVPLTGVTMGSTTVQVATNSQSSNTAAFTVNPTEVVSVAGANNANFVVLDFTTPPPPPPVNVTPPYTGGSALSCSGSMVAVGNRVGGQIALFDISDPANPKQVGQTISSGFGGVSAIKLNANRILAGELNGSRVLLIDVSNLASFHTGTPLTTPIASVTSVGLSGSKAVVAGTNETFIDVVTVSGTTLSNPTPLDPGMGTGLKVALDMTTVAVGSPTSVNSPVKLFDISGSTATPVASATSDLNGIFSIAIKGMEVVAGSSNSFNVDMIDFSASTPTVTSFNPNIGGGWTVTRTATRMGLGNITGNNVAIFNVTPTTASLVANVNSGINSIGAVCISDF